MLAALAADENLWPLYRNLNTYRGSDRWINRTGR